MLLGSGQTLRDPRPALVPVLCFCPLCRLCLASAPGAAAGAATVSRNLLVSELGGESLGQRPPHDYLPPQGRDHVLAWMGVPPRFGALASGVTRAVTCCVALGEY